MIYKILAVLLLITLAQTQQGLEVALAKSYCQPTADTQTQLYLQITQDQNERVPSQTQALIQTQAYESNGKMIQLFYFEDMGNVFIQEVTQNMTSLIHKQDISNPVIPIDAKDKYILVKEVYNPNNGQFAYVLLIANIGTSKLLTKFYYSSQKVSGYDISDLSIQKILSIEGKFMYIIMGQENKASVWKLNVEVLGDIMLVGYLSWWNTLDVAFGNQKYLYEANYQQFYEQSGTPDWYNYTAKSFSDLKINTLISPSKMKFTELYNVVLVYSYVNKVMTILPIDSSISPQRAVFLNSSSEPTIFTDGYKNFVAFSSTDLVWIRTSSTGVASKQFSTSLSETARQTLLSTFLQAQYISFDGLYAMITKKTTKNIRGSLASVMFDPTTYPFFTISTELQINLPTSKNTYDDLSKSSTNYVSSYKCNCIKYEVLRFQCVASRLKCTTVTRPIRTDCTKTS